jgi:hypothetical protein
VVLLLSSQSKSKVSKMRKKNQKTKLVIQLNFTKSAHHCSLLIAHASATACAGLARPTRAPASPRPAHACPPQPSAASPRAHAPVPASHAPYSPPRECTCGLGLGFENFFSSIAVSGWGTGVRQSVCLGMSGWGYYRGNVIFFFYFLFFYLKRLM